MRVETVEGVFLREDTHRFACWVRINGEDKKCYVPSSTKLSRYLSLCGKKVLLREHTKPNVKTEYRLFAVEQDGGWTIIDLNILNQLYEEQIDVKQIEKREYVVSEKYRADFAISENIDKQTIVEIKGIISEQTKVNFPMFSGERALRQIEDIKRVLLEKDYYAEYIFIILSSCVEEIEIDKKNSKYLECFAECRRNGLKVSVYRAYYDKGYAYIKKDNVTVL